VSLEQITPLIAIQLLQFSAEVDWMHPRINLTVVLLGLVMLLGASLFMGGWRKTLGRAQNLELIYSDD
jgi:hypothetical protein